MNTVPQTATPPAPSSALAPPPAARAGAGARLGATLPLMCHAGFVVAVVLSAVLNANRLAQNGYSNNFYSPGVKSMLRSLHNFVFVSFDPGGFVSVDKPPLGLWLQAASAKAFGFSPMSLLLPEAIAGVLTVALLYVVLARRVGTAAAFVGAVTLAVFPSFVAVSRDTGVDSLLILLMLLACAAGLRASETGRWRWLIASAVFVGLAFNTKTLAAVLVVPGIAVGYVVCAPGSLANRAGKLLVAGMVMLAVSFAWIAFGELTPASKPPYVGSSTNNTELGLTFEYNGFGRVEGQVGGPGRGARRRGGPGRRPGPGRPAARRPRARAESTRHASLPRQNRACAETGQSQRSRLLRRQRNVPAQRQASPTAPLRQHPQPRAAVRQGTRRPGALDDPVRAVRADRARPARLPRAPLSRGLAPG